MKLLSVAESDESGRTFLITKIYTAVSGELVYELHEVNIIGMLVTEDTLNEDYTELKPE